MKLYRGATDGMKTDAFGELHQCFGNSRLEVPKYDILDLFGRQPQFAAQDFKKDHAKIGPVFEDRQNIPPVQYQEFAVGQCGGVSASLVAIEYGDFAKDLARVEDRKNDLSSALGERADFYAAP